MKSEFLANFFWLLHLMLVIFAATGPFYLPSKYIKYFILIFPMIILDWNDYDGVCFLSNLENKLRKNPKKTPSFFRPMVKKIFGVKLDTKISYLINFSIFINGFLYGLYRLSKIYNIGLTFLNIYLPLPLTTGISYLVTLL